MAKRSRHNCRGPCARHPEVSRLIIGSNQIGRLVTLRGRYRTSSFGVHFRLPRHYEVVFVAILAGKIGCRGIRTDINRLRIKYVGHRRRCDILKYYSGNKTDALALQKETAICFFARLDSIVLDNDFGRNPAELSAFQLDRQLESVNEYRPQYSQPALH